MLSILITISAIIIVAIAFLLGVGTRAMGISLAIGLPIMVIYAIGAGVLLKALIRRSKE